MRRVLPLLLLAALSLVHAEVPVAVRARLSKLLPPVETGVSAGQPRFYSSDLYQYIDGGAEVFHNYDMVALAHQEYRLPGVELTLDIYDMGDPLNAFGVYSSERSPTSRFLPIGAGCNAGDLALNFWQAAFYVKLSAFGEKGRTAPALEAFARAVSRRIGTDKSAPGFLALFPPRGLVARSQVYVKRAPLGHNFLAPAFLAAYRFGSRETTLVLSRAASAEEAMARAEQLRRHFSETGKVRPSRQARGAYRGSNSFEGEWLFFPHAGYAVILVNPPAEPGALVKEVIARIP